MKKCLTQSVLEQFPLAFYQRSLMYLSQRNKWDYIFDLRSAAHLGLAEAQYKLSLHYLKGEIVLKNISKSLEYLNLAFQQGYLPAINNRACYYYHGIGGDVDQIKACQLFEKAGKGNMAAFMNFAYCLMHGQGCEAETVVSGEMMAIAEKRSDEIVDLLVTDPVLIN